MIRPSCYGNTAISAIGNVYHDAWLPQMERRERLRKLMAAMDEDTVAEAFEALGPGFSVAEHAPTKEVFYTEGPETLLDARMQARRLPFCIAPRRCGCSRCKIA